MWSLPTLALGEYALPAAAQQGLQSRAWRLQLWTQIRRIVLGPCPTCSRLRPRPAPPHLGLAVERVLMVPAGSITRERLKSETFTCLRVDWGSAAGSGSGQA